MTWAGTEAVLDAVKTALTTGLSAKLTTVAARYTGGPTLTAPSTTTGYLTALIGTGGELLRDALTGVTVPSVIILAGDETPENVGYEGKALVGSYDTVTDVMVFVRVRAGTLADSDQALMRYCVAVQEVLTAAGAFTSHQCNWVGTAGTVIEIPSDDSYLLRSRGTAYRVRSFDQGA